MERHRGSRASVLHASGSNEIIYCECSFKKTYSVSGQCYLFICISAPFFLEAKYYGGLGGGVVGGKNLEMRSTL